MITWTLPADRVIDAPAAVGIEMAVNLQRVLVVHVEGDVDIATAPQLLQTLQDVLSHGSTGAAGAGAAGDGPSAAPASEGGSRALVLDLSEVDFIDSAAIGVLVQGHHLARRSGRTYALVATHPMIHTLFQITGLARVLPLHPDVTAAVRSLGPTTHPASH